jgi:hypothetical protein
MRWHMTIVPAFRRVRWEDCKFKACFKEKQNKILLNRLRHEIALHPWMKHRMRGSLKVEIQPYALGHTTE